MRRLNGVGANRFETVIGVAVREHVPFWKRHNRIYAGTEPRWGYLGVVTPHDRTKVSSLGEICGADVSGIRSGDILKLEDDGTITFLWEKDARDNAIFLTSRCDCSCLMCPQPMSDSDHFKEARKILSLLRKKEVTSLCLTGGEPTLDRDKFIEILGDCCQYFPDAQIDVLTNGKSFADNDFVECVAAIASRNTRFCISIHADVANLHDRITGGKGNFNKTCAGIYNIWRKGLQLELRTVITRLNYRRLPTMAEFFCNFMPFCGHYAFMALEYHGDAAKNRHLIGIDSDEYSEELKQACHSLWRNGLDVSVYNVPLCLCAEEVKAFARQSISGWKNFFPDECANCSKQGECCGFFSTSDHIPLRKLICAE